MTHNPPSHKVKRKRPFGVLIIVALQIATFAALIIELIILNQSGETHLLRALQNDFELPRIFFTAIGFIIAFGLWRLRRWAWVALMIQLGLYLTLDLAAYFQGNPSYWTMLVNVVTVFYFNQYEVQAIFQTGKEPQRNFQKNVKRNE